MKNNILIVWFIFLGTVYSLSCTQQYECASVTNDYNYVICDSGTCRCRTENGFIGAATTNDKCRCPSSTEQVNYLVAYKNGLAYCKNCTEPSNFYWAKPAGYDQSFPFCSNPVTADERYRRDAVWQNNAYKLFVEYTKQQPSIEIILGFKPTPEIAPVSAIRAYPIGNIGSIAEYLYGLTAITNPNATIRSISVDTEQGVLCVEVDFEFLDITGLIGKTTLTGCLKIDENDQFYSADIAYPGLGKTLNPKNEFELFFRKNFSDHFVCDVHETYCTGENQQYPNYESCYNFMVSLSYGDYDKFQGNNTICRDLHSLIATFHPHIHCPHMGPFGGHQTDLQCVDITASTYYDIDL